MTAPSGKVTVSSKAKTVAAKTQPARKAAAKPAVKAKPVVKAKPAAKPATGKATVKTVKPVPKKAVAKTTAKVAVKAQPKAPSRAPTKPKASAAPSKVTTSKTVAKPTPQAKPAVKSTAQPASQGRKTVAQPAVPPVQAMAQAVKPSVAATQPVPVAKRVSSRLAQLTVPSMAQAVASTAAKASFIPTMTTTLTPLPLPMAIKKDPKLANNWKTKAAEELTDAELLAMPDSEYMNDKQLAAFRLRLMQQKKDIHNNAGETTEHLREDTVVVPDPADRATIEEEHALELRTRDRERKLLKKIEQAIARIDAGDYGYCDETGEPIGVGRLLARPTATLSLEAQQRRELKQKMFGD